MKKRLSIHDIAKHLQASATMVPFVLKGKTKALCISKEVEKKVWHHVKRTSYQPDLIANSLRTGRSRITGTRIEDIADPFFINLSRF